MSPSDFRKPVGGEPDHAVRDPAPGLGGDVRRDRPQPWPVHSLTQCVVLHNARTYPDTGSVAVRAAHTEKSSWTQRVGNE
jgi:hypothetical protein